MPDSEKPIITFQAPTALAKRIADRARQGGRSKSNVIRMALESGLAAPAATDKMSSDAALTGDAEAAIYELIKADLFACLGSEVDGLKLLLADRTAALAMQLARLDHHLSVSSDPNESLWRLHSSMSESLLKCLHRLGTDSVSESLVEGIAAKALTAASARFEVTEPEGSA